MSGASQFASKIGNKVKQMGQQVEQRVKERVASHQSEPGLPAQLAQLDPESNQIYSNYLHLGAILKNLDGLARASIESVQKLCNSNSELSGFIHKEVTGPVADFFDISEIASKFVACNTLMSNSYFAALLHQLDTSLVMPFAQEKQKDEDTRRLIENCTSERLIEHLLIRNEKRAVLIAQGMLVLMQAQAVFFKGTSDLFQDFSESVAPKLNQLKSRELQHPHPAPTHASASTPVPAKNSPAPPKPQARGAQASAPPEKAVNSFMNTQAFPEAVVLETKPSPSNQPIDFFSSESSVTSNFMDAHPATGNGGNTLFDFDDQPSSKSTNAPILDDSADPFGLNGSSSWNSQVLKPSSASRDPFADMFGMGLTPQPGPTIPSAQATNGSPAVHPSFYNDHEDDKPKIVQKSKILAEDKYDDESVNRRINDKIGALHAREAEQEREANQRRELDSVLTAKIEKWAGGRRGNLRSLLSTLHLIMWEGSGWKEIPMATLVTPDKLKLGYRKALIIVHPDKLGDKTLEQRFLCERILDLLNDAHKNEESLQ